MGRIYKMSADISEKEKVIGGVLTLVQGLYLATGFVVTGVSFFILQKVMPAFLAFLFGVFIGIPPALAFTFYKKNDIPLATYLKYKSREKKKTKYLINDYKWGREQVLKQEEGK